MSCLPNSTISLNVKLQLKEEGVNTIVFESAMSFDQFKKNSDGMIPVVVQDYKTDKVLMPKPIHSFAQLSAIIKDTPSYLSCLIFEKS